MWLLSHLISPHSREDGWVSGGNCKVQNMLSVQQGLQHSETGQPVGDTPYGGLKAPPFGEIPLETALTQGGGVWQTHFCAKTRDWKSFLFLSLICCGANERGSLLTFNYTPPLGAWKSTASCLWQQFFICHFISFFFSSSQTVGFTKLLRQLLYQKGNA